MYGDCSPSSCRWVALSAEFGIGGHCPRFARGVPLLRVYAAEANALHVAVLKCLPCKSSVFGLIVIVSMLMSGRHAVQILDVQSSQAELTALGSLLKMIKIELASNSNFEFIQAFLKLLLQIHGEAIMQQPDLQLQAKQLQIVLAKSWSRIDQLLQSSRCMLGFFGNLQT